MAWYKKAANLTLSKSNGSHWTDEYSPGEMVPYSGIYRCIGCKKEVTSNADEPFPPQNHHQHTVSEGPIRWKLIVRTNTEGK